MDFGVTLAQLVRHRFQLVALNVHQNGPPAKLDDHFRRCFANTLTCAGNDDVAAFH